MIIINEKLSISFTYTLSKKGERKTVCDILDVDDSIVVSTGVARCNKEDNFSKEEGRKISLRKALECMPFPIRTMAWKAYFNRNRKPSEIGKKIVDGLNELFRMDPAAALALANMNVNFNVVYLDGSESSFDPSLKTTQDGKTVLPILGFLDSLLPENEWIATTWDDASSTNIDDFLGFTIVNPDDFRSSAEASEWRSCPPKSFDFAG